MSKYVIIRKILQTVVERGRKNFILYPFGENGMQVKRILNECFGIKEQLIIDNQLCKYNYNIKSLEYLLEEYPGG